MHLKKLGCLTDSTSRRLEETGYKSRPAFKLVGQAKHPDSPFDFADWSSKEHLTGDWKAKIKAKLAYVDVACILCGKNMSTAGGVSREIEMLQELGKPYFLLAAYTDGSTKPTAATVSDKIYKWTWDNLKTLVGGGR